jgi:hypothetical protein
MHNEMVGKRTVRRAAFVCFKAAEVRGIHTYLIFACLYMSTRVCVCVWVYHAPPLSASRPLRCESASHLHTHTHIRLQPAHTHRLCLLQGHDVCVHVFVFCVRRWEANSSSLMACVCCGI